MCLVTKYVTHFSLNFSTFLSPLSYLLIFSTLPISNLQSPFLSFAIWANLYSCPCAHCEGLSFLVCDKVQSMPWKPKICADFNYLVFPLFAVCQGRNNGSGICCRFRPSGLWCCVARLVLLNILMKCNAVKASWKFVTYCHFPKGLNSQLHHCGKLRACKEWNTCFIYSTLTKKQTHVLNAVHSQRMKCLFYMWYTHKEGNTCLICSTLTKNESPVWYAVHSQWKKYSNELQ